MALAITEPEEIQEDVDECLMEAITEMDKGSEPSYLDVVMRNEDNPMSVGAAMFGSCTKKSSKGHEEYNDLFSMEMNSEGGVVLSAEILVSIATKSKLVFRAFRGLVDTGMSASLMDWRLLLKDQPNGGKRGKCAKWTTQAGIFQTQSRVCMKKVKLPQFTTKRTFQADFHLFDRKESDQYSFILGRDVLQNIKLDVLFSKNAF